MALPRNGRPESGKSARATRRERIMENIIRHDFNFFIANVRFDVPVYSAKCTHLVVIT